MKKKILNILFLAVWGLCGCDSWLTIQPETIVTPEELYKTPEGFEDALIGCYQLMADNYSYNRSLMTGALEHMACAWETTNNSVEEKLGLHEYTDEDVDKVLGSVFRIQYKAITNVSELIEAINAQDGILKRKQRDRLLGEALGLRAFLHLDLIRLWGPMPAEVDENRKYLPFVENMQIEPYSYLTYADYMKKVCADLDQAEVLLKSVYGEETFRSQYINYFSVLALQARCHFWMGNRDRALAYGERLLAPDTLKNFPLTVPAYEHMSFEDIFRNEAIFKYVFSSNTPIQLSIVYNYKTYIHSDLFGGNGSDRRLDFWGNEYHYQNETDTRLYLTKYDVAKENIYDETEIIKGQVPIIRISEIYLMMIELTDLERANALYEEYCTSRNSVFRKFESTGEIRFRLLDEYRREFSGEGQLFYHYKRWGIQNMPRCGRGCGESAYVLPLPKGETEVSH